MRVRLSSAVQNAAAACIGDNVRHLIGLRESSTKWAEVLAIQIHPAHGIKGYNSSAAAVQGQLPLAIDLSRSAGLVLALARVGVPKAVGLFT